MSDGGRFKIVIEPAAGRFLESLRDPLRDHIQDAIRSLADDPTPPESLPMTGKALGLHRLRVDDFRVVYRIKHERITILVLRVGHRSSVYSGLEPD